MKLQVWKPGTQKLAQVAKSVSTQAKDKEFTLTGQPDTHKLKEVKSIKHFVKYIQERCS